MDGDLGHGDVPDRVDAEACAPAASREPVTSDNLAAPAGISAVRDHPAFRGAARALARATLTGFRDADSDTRWMTADLGRTSLYIIALVLDGLPGGVTVASLKAVAAAYDIASAGRVTAFVDYALRAGRLMLSPGSEAWTRRRLRPTSAFIQALGRILAAQMRALAPVAPELELAAERLESDAAVAVAVTEGVRLTTALHGQDLDWLAPLMVFMGRDGGQRFIEHLLGRECGAGTRLLERAPLNISQAARACAVSRRHLDNLIADATAAGLLRLGGDGMIDIAPPVSAALEGYYAVHVRGFRLMAQKVLEAGAGDFGRFAEP